MSEGRGRRSRKESSARGVKAPLTHMSLCVLCCCWGSVQYESGAGLAKQYTQTNHSEREHTMRKEKIEGWRKE